MRYTVDRFEERKKVMDVLIKGLQMQEGRVYNISLIPRGRAIVHNEDGTACYYDAIEIPPHGRLIDADRFEADNPRHMDADVPYVTEMTVKDILDEAPTVIEASE